jgi:hypothetical protein
MQPFGSKYLFTKPNIESTKSSSNLFQWGTIYGGLDTWGTRRLDSMSPNTNETFSTSGSKKTQSLMNPK